MTATLLYRISAFVLVLFAAGHTLGFLKFKAPTPEGVAVQQAMDGPRGWGVEGINAKRSPEVAASLLSLTPKERGRSARSGLKFDQQWPFSF